MQVGTGENMQLDTIQAVHWLQDVSGAHAAFDGTEYTFTSPVYRPR